MLFIVIIFSETYFASHARPPPDRQDRLHNIDERAIVCVAPDDTARRVYAMRNPFLVRKRGVGPCHRTCSPTLRPAKTHLSEIGHWKLGDGIGTGLKYDRCDI